MYCRGKKERMTNLAHKNVMVFMLYKFKDLGTGCGLEIECRTFAGVILAQKYHERKSLTQLKWMRFSSYLINFNEIFGKKMSKSPTISPENNPYIVLVNF